MSAQPFLLFATLCGFHALSSPPQDPVSVDDKSLPEWVRSLTDPTQRTAAVEVLRKANPKDSLAALVGGVNDAQPEAAWQALRALGQLAPTTKEQRAAFTEAARALAEITKKTETAQPTRVIAALAIGAVLPHADRGIEDLIALLKPSTPSHIRIAAAVALGAGGATTAKSMAKLPVEGDLATGLTSLAAIGLLGINAASCKGRLRDLIDKDEGLRAFLLCRAAKDTLTAVGGGKAADEAWDNLTKRCRKGPPKLTSKKINPFGYIPGNPATAALFLNESLGSPCPPNVEGFGVPASFPPPLVGTSLGTAEAIQAMALHCVQSIRDFGLRRRSDSFVSHAEWKLAVDAIAVTIEMLSVVE